MKRLILVGGPMGVGKTTACQLLKQRLPRCAFLDGDWCWDMHPFVVTDETRAMVMDNIVHLLSGFQYSPVICCWSYSVQNQYSGSGTYPQDCL